MSKQCVRDWIGDELYCDAQTFYTLEKKFCRDYPDCRWEVLSDAVDAMLQQGLLKTFKIRTKCGSNEDYSLYYTTKETEVWIDYE